MACPGVQKLFEGKGFESTKHEEISQYQCKNVHYNKTHIKSVVITYCFILLLLHFKTGIQSIQSII